LHTWNVVGRVVAGQQSFTLAFAVQLRKKHGKTSVIIQYTYYQNTHTHTHITKQYKTTTVQIKMNTVQDIPK